MRLKGIDLIKGFLIITVIIGHFLIGSQSENILKYSIYSFHMPVFIGISGFLFNNKSLIQTPFIEQISKYLYRTILPWFIAVLIFFITLNKSPNIFHELINSFKMPYFHLWFIPGFMSWVLITWAAKKIKIKDSQLLVFSFIISLLFYILFLNPVFFSEIPFLSRFLEIILYNYAPYFYFYFVLGFYLKNNSIPLTLNKNLIVSFLLFTSTVILFFHPEKIIKVILFFLFNSSLLFLAINLSIKEQLPRSKSIEWIGQNSMGIYLWHVIPILIIKYNIDSKYKISYYFLSIFIQIIFLVVFYQATKIKFINKYLFGNNL